MSELAMTVSLQGRVYRKVTPQVVMRSLSIRP